MKTKLAVSVVTLLLSSTYLSANKTTKLDTITVSETQSNSTGYTNQLKQETSTGSRLGLTIKETPASVEVINSKTMEQRGDTTINQAVTKAVGITGGESGHGPGGRFLARGFLGSGYPGIDILTDGVKLESPHYNNATEVANLDRIDIIKGASSVLNGEGSIGATVNLVTKKPSFTKEDTELGFKAGSYDSYTTVDLTLDYIYNKNITFSFLLKNLTDELYATSAENRLEVFLGEARSFEFGINYKF